jgi:hypothetical protein
MSVYVTQLNYGKENLLPAERWHRLSYGFAGGSTALFAAGVIVAALSLK